MDSLVPEKSSEAVFSIKKVLARSLRKVSVPSTVISSVPLDKDCTIYCLSLIAEALLLPVCRSLSQKFIYGEPRISVPALQDFSMYVRYDLVRKVSFSNQILLTRIWGESCLKRAFFSNFSGFIK